MSKKSTTTAVWADKCPDCQSTGECACYKYRYQLGAALRRVEKLLTKRCNDGRYRTLCSKHRDELSPSELRELVYELKIRTTQLRLGLDQLLLAPILLPKRLADHVLQIREKYETDKKLSDEEMNMAMQYLDEKLQNVPDSQPAARR
ncbi:hypothetical protein GE09DRAFT_1060601 [Coniochaeta sp. 2T2.1]|nr:hypothetical protein GE09DRAFT_1060601 [Coniochaeta sp. 2T2.1]